MAAQITYPTWSDYSFGFVPGTELPASAVFEHVSQSVTGELDVVVEEETLTTDDYPDGISVLNVRIGRHPFYLQLEDLDDESDDLDDQGDDDLSVAGALIDLYARPDASDAELWFLDTVRTSVRISFDLGAWGPSALTIEDDAEVSAAATRIAEALDEVPGLFEFEGRRTEEGRETLHLPAGSELPAPPADWSSPVEYNVGRGAWVPATGDDEEDDGNGMPENLAPGVADAILADAGYDADGDPIRDAQGDVTRDAQGEAARDADRGPDSSDDTEEPGASGTSR